LKLIAEFDAPMLPGGWFSVERNRMLGVMMLPAVSLVPKRPTFSEELLPIMMPGGEALYGSRGLVPVDTRVPPLATVTEPDPFISPHETKLFPIATVDWLLQSDHAPVTSA
jgi:hypothetical protein